MPDAIPPEPLAAPLRPRRRGPRPLVILVVILSPVVAFAIWSRVQTHRLDAALDAIEARGELLNPSSFDTHPETADQEEAARLYTQAAQLTGSIVTARFLPAAKTIDDLSVLARAQAAGEPRLAVLKEAEAPLDEALRTIDRAAGLDARGRRRGERFFLMTSLAAAGKIRVARLALSGDGDAAARALVSVMRLRRMDPFWFRPFVASTRDSLRLILTFADPSEARLGELQQEYAALDRDLDVAQYLMFSRAEFLRMALPSEFGDPDTDARQRTNPLQIVLTGLTKPLRASAVLSDLRRYDAVLDAARQPWPAKLDAVAPILEASAGSSPEPARRPSLFTMLVRPWGSNVLPNMNRIVMAIAGAVSYARVSQAALAIARYRAARAGALPPALHDLVPGYLPEALLDPYTGRELVYRPAGAAYTIYSVGSNRQDDGGVWATKSDVWTNRQESPKDLGIAVGAWPADR